MKAKGNIGVMSVAGLLLGSLGVLLATGERPEAAQGWGAGLELLVNGSFDGPMGPQGPTGWFRAMLPAQTDSLQAGTEQIPPRGNVAFLEQAGVKIQLANNWAQHVHTVPVGATIRVTADVKTQHVPANTGFVMVQCWDAANQLIGGASSQSVEPIGGTEDWKHISFAFVVPPGTGSMILRCGLAQSGKIWFDNVSMKAISGAAGGLRNRGFEVTEESLKQLQRVHALSDGLLTYAQQELGADAHVRTEVLAQGDGRFQVVLLLDLSKPQ